MDKYQFKDGYRIDVKNFLDSPGGKYFMATVVAEEARLWAEATKKLTAAEKATSVDKWSGLYWCRDLLVRWSQPKVVPPKGQVAHSPAPSSVDISG